MQGLEPLGEQESESPAGQALKEHSMTTKQWGC